MVRPNVFVASSKRAIPLAEQLSVRLKHKANVHRWWKPEAAFKPGAETLTALVNECKWCHFAVVLLTRDDVQLKGGQQPQLKPRDNCIFEAGLFTGGLGLEPKRCLLVVSVNWNDLPSDLRGLTYIAFKEPRKLSDIGQCREAVEEAASKIIRTISHEPLFDKPDLPCLTTQRLMSNEKLDEEGGRLINGAHIVVNSPHPLERSNEFAEQVLANLKNSCRYKYFFHGDQNNLNVIAELLQSLAAAGLGSDDLMTRKTKMTRSPHKVRENLGHLKERLQIYFVKKTKLFYCCIHNAHDPGKAVCYLRYPDDDKPVFVEWFKNKNACLMSGELTSLCKQPKKAKRNGRTRRKAYIFCSTREFDLFDDSKKQFQKALWDELEGIFPREVLPELHEACFGVRKGR